MTSSDIRQRALERLDESAASSVRYASADLDQYALDGARFYVVKTGCQVETISVIQNQSYALFHDLPCDLVQVLGVVWNDSGVWTPLEPTIARDLDEAMYQWQRMTDTRSRHYFLFGLNKIALWPQTENTETYIVRYRADVYDRISAVPIEDHEALVNYVVARCLLAERKTKEGLEEYMKYLNVVTAAKKRMASVDRTWSMGAL